MFLVESRERLDDIRKWRSRWWGHDGSGVPASFPGFGTSVTKFVGRKEADRVGSWRLRCFYLRQINSHRCALCVTRKHQLSRSSPRSLSVFVPTVSLWQLVRPSLHSVSLPELPFHGGFYPVSTPITAIRHRWSSFCTWPTYLPLSPESFSRCRLRWTTPPSPQRFFIWLCCEHLQCVSLFGCVVSICSAFLYLVVLWAFAVRFLIWLCCEHLQCVSLFGCVVSICSAFLYLVVLWAFAVRFFIWLCCEHLQCVIYELCFKIWTLLA